MTRCRISGDFRACRALPRRAVPCQDRESTCPMPRKASNALRNCPSRRSSSEVEICDGNPVHDANTAPIGIAARSVCRDHRVFVPWATIQNWVEAGGKKGRGPRRRRLSRLGTQQHIHARIAIDMLRDAQAAGRFDTTHTLHHARAA